MQRQGEQTEGQATLGSQNRRTGELRDRFWVASGGSWGDFGGFGGVTGGRKKKSISWIL